MSHVESIVTIAIQKPEIQERIKKQAFSGVKNHSDAQDITQNVILKTLIYQEKYKYNNNIEGRLSSITRNETMNHHRRKKRKPTTHIDPTNYVINAQESYNDGPNTIDLEKIHICINQLDKQSQSYIRLLTQGYKYTDIAQETNTPLGTIQSKIFTARKKLKKLLLDMDPNLEPLTRKKSHKSSKKPSQNSTQE